MRYTKPTTLKAKPRRAVQTAFKPLFLPSGITYGNGGKTRQTEPRTAHGRQLKTWLYGISLAGIFLLSAAMEAAAI